MVHKTSAMDMLWASHLVLVVVVIPMLLASHLLVLGQHNVTTCSWESSPGATEVVVVAWDWWTVVVDQHCSSE